MDGQDRVKEPGQRWRAVLLGVLAAATFAAGFLHRTRAVESLDDLDGRFTGTDAYYWYRQTERIIKEGGLPERDMERWLPLGRDLSLLPNLYAYATAYSYRAARVFIPSLTLYKFCSYAPPILFAIAAALFLTALWTCLSWDVAVIAALFLVFSPSIASRTGLGYADRDAFCLLLAILMGALYLWQMQALRRRNRILIAGACGFAACFGCMAWQGFGVFVLCVLLPSAVGAWRHREKVLELYVFCGCLTVPLMLFSRAHRFWSTFSEPVFPAGWVVVFPALLAVSLFIIRQTHRNSPPVALRLASYLPVLLLVSLLAYRKLLSDGTAITLAGPLIERRLMQTITEQGELSFSQWLRRFGAPQLVVASAGIVGFWQLLLRRKFPILPKQLMLWKRRESPTLEIGLFGTFWILLWLILTLQAKRYVIMLAPAIAVWCSVALVWAGREAQQRSQNRLGAVVLRAVLIGILPLAMLLWKPAGGLIDGSERYVSGRSARPNAAWHEAMLWMSRGLDRNEGKPVVAAWWSVGSQLNVLADAATVVDQDTWKHYWIHLLARHLYCAKSEAEALRFLKTRGADYWMLTGKDMRSPRRIAHLGSAVQPDRSMDFARKIWYENGSEAFKLIFKNAEVKVFRIHYPPNMNVSAELYETWTASNFPDPELRRAWMEGE